MVDGGLTAQWVIALSATVTGGFVSWAAASVARSVRDFLSTVEDNAQRSARNRRALRTMGADHLPPADHQDDD